MHHHARQGDIVFCTANFGANFDGARAVNHVIAGSGSSSHVITGVAMVKREGDETRIRVIEPTTVTHADRHLDVSLPAGDYSVWPLRERHGSVDRPVED